VDGTVQATHKEMRRNSVHGAVKCGLRLSCQNELLASVLPVPKGRLKILNGLAKKAFCPLDIFF
jgi:hypothetical protein